MPSVSMTKRQQIAERGKQLRDDLLAECGWDTEQRRQLLGKALTRINEQLDAKKLVVVDKEAVEVIDNQAVLRAAEAVTTLEGVNVGKSNDGGSTGPISITINANWFDPGPTTSSGEGMVIESGPAKLLEDKES